MFAYVFGGAIALPGCGSYHEYLIGGMLGMGLAQTAPGVAVALVTDMSTGLIDRFRSLPMSRWAVLTARSIAELLTQIISAVVVVCVGLTPSSPWSAWRSPCWPCSRRWRCTCTAARRSAKRHGTPFQLPPQPWTGNGSMGYTSDL